MVASTKTRAAVIGLGPHGLRHIQAYQRLDDVEVIAVCDVRPENVQSAMEQLPSARGYADWERLLNKERLDVISVVTNGPTHAPITIAAAQAGVSHVLCEKPMATSVNDALEMVRVCHEHRTRLSVSHGRRWVEGYRKLGDLIATGLIGKLCHFWLTCGGGLFAGNGTHFLDLARMLSKSDPVSVVASLDKTARPNPRGAQFEDPGAIALFYFENGMRLVIDMSEDINVSQRIELVGTSGRVLIDELEGRWEIGVRPIGEDEARSRDWWLPLDSYPFEPPSFDMVEILAEGLKELLGNDKLSCSGEDGLAAVQMVIGAHVSSRSGCVPVQLPLSESYQKIDIPLT